MSFVPALVPYIVAASAVVSAVSAIRQGNAAEAAANFNANVQEQNAAASRAQARQQAQQIDRENYLRLGAIRAAQGKSGGEAGQGSVLDVLGDVAAQGELDKQNAIYSGEMAARGYTNTANLDRESGSTASTNGYFKAGTELLSGGASAYTSYNRLNRG